VNRWKTPLGTLEAVRGVTGETFIAFTPAAGRSGMLRLSADDATEAAASLLAAALDLREVKAVPVQERLFEAGAA